MSALPAAMDSSPRPEAPPRVLLVGNYSRDAQQSMLRFANMLREGLRARGMAVDLIAPEAVLNRRWPTFHGAGKWLAYADKYLLFPRTLRRRVRRLGPNAVVHICDHSNAVYAPAAAAAGHPVVVTCHDLGAVRGALGEATDCPASATGKLLQRWITRSLAKADGIACVSNATRADVERLIRRPDGSRPETRVIRLGLNAPFRPLGAEEARARLREVPDFDADAPFALNVGSSLTRKNRAGVLRIFARALAPWPQGRLVFAGEALPADLRALAHSLGVSERVTEVVDATDAVLEALYSRATALLFPSRFEGFGWPAIEAQACGCPVLSSGAGALGEVVAGSGFVRAAEDEAAFAGELVRLAHDPAARAQWVRLGCENVSRFTTDAMVDAYVALYQELLAQPAVAVAPVGETARV